jgi:SprT protein
MDLFRQLEFVLINSEALTSRLRSATARRAIDLEGEPRCPRRIDKLLAASPPNLTSSSERPIHLRGRDHALESRARQLLRALGAPRLASRVRVEWNPRLKTCAGRADYRRKLILLNPLLRDLQPGQAVKEPNTAPIEPVAHRLDRLKRSSLTNNARWISKNKRPDVVAHDEIERTLRHELAHLLAQFRVGRRRILPHGKEWRNACRDLGIAGEARCHNLPFPTRTHTARFVYSCPNCGKHFTRVRRIRRAVACLACCRKYSGGDFDARFRLKRVA